MIFKHTSVLYDACMENLNIEPEGIYVDGTWEEADMPAVSVKDSAKRGR